LEIVTNTEDREQFKFTGLISRDCSKNFPLTHIRKDERSERKRDRERCRGEKLIM
jgi:hypothetical protein